MTPVFTWTCLRRIPLVGSCADFLAHTSLSLAGTARRATKAAARHAPTTGGALTLALLWVGLGMALLSRLWFGLVTPRAATFWVGTGAARGVARVLAGIGAARVARVSIGVGAACVARLWRNVLVVLHVACKGAWRHAPSAVCTAGLLYMSASLAGVPGLLALLLWGLAALTSLATWNALEPFVLRRLGCRSPGHLERDRLDPAVGPARLEVVILDAPQPWMLHGLRSLVVSRALLDLLEDRALAGLLTQATIRVRSASLPGELVIWLGNAPLLGAWLLSRSLMTLGRLLAILVGTSLVVPLVLWPDGFARWAGRVFGAALIGLLGSALLSSGLSAAGLGLLLAWVVVPGLRALVSWEAARAEVTADDATLESGRGWELLEALETLTWAESVLPPTGPLGRLYRVAAPLTARADRLWQKLAEI